MRHWTIQQVAIALITALPVFAGTPEGNALYPSHGIGSATKIFENDNDIGIGNAQARVLFSKKDGSLLGIWGDGDKNLIIRNNMGRSLWKMTLFHKIPYSSVVKYLDIAPQKKAIPEIGTTKNENGHTLTITYKNLSTKVKRNKIECDLTLSISIDDNSPNIRWQASVMMKNKLASVWDFEYPMLYWASPDENPADVKMLTPYRRGVAVPFRASNSELPYPGPAVKFQFMAVYGEKSGQGRHYATDDSNGYRKIFHQRAFKNNAMLHAIRHYPANRLIGGSGFEMPYSVITRAYKGGWWEAARIYRQWWLQQKWASKGVMLTRKETPEWLKNAELSIKVSTSKPARTIKGNLKNSKALFEMLEGLPVYGIWYNYQPLANTRFCGFGHDVKPRPGVSEALKEFKKMNFHIVAYIQSMIYDQDFDKKDLPFAETFLSKDIIGGLAPYHEKVCACRYTKSWQKRSREMAATAMKAGFEGIYLDSFGKGSPECFARHHKHAIGGGNTGITGQRAMNKSIRKLVKTFDANATMSGEAPTEAFVDELDVYLFAVNSLSNYVPLWRTIFGDYMIGHGRGLTFSRSRDNIIPQLSGLFLEGAIFGRVHASGTCILLHEGNEKYLAFFKKLVNYNKNGGLEYLRFGEYLKPLKLSPAPEKMTYQEYVQNNKVTIPYVMNSVTRSHKDGSTAFVFVNVGTKPYKGSFAIPAEILKGKNKTAIFAMSESGEKKKIANPNENGKIEFEIAPNEVKFFIAK